MSVDIITIQGLTCHRSRKCSTNANTPLEIDEKKMTTNSSCVPSWDATMSTKEKGPLLLLWSNSPHEAVREGSKWRGNDWLGWSLRSHHHLLPPPPSTSSTLHYTALSHRIPSREHRFPSPSSPTPLLTEKDSNVPSTCWMYISSHISSRIRI